MHTGKGIPVAELHMKVSKFPQTDLAQTHFLIGSVYR